MCALALVQDATQARPEEVWLGQLTLGVKCGGIDDVWFASNPAFGWAVDRVVEAGGTVYLSETSNGRPARGREGAVDAGVADATSKA